MSPWEDRFSPEPVPEWLLAFDKAPVQAVDSLLGHRFYLGSLNGADPEELLVDWALLLDEEDGFTNRLDQALTAWVEKTWGTHPSGMSEARLADAWSRLANVVAYIEDLPETAHALRARFEESEKYLGPLTTSPSRDPLGRYLAAIAEHQEDRSLAPFWLRLCDLPDGVPFYHAPYAIAGLLGLPPLDETQAGAFREEAAHGLLQLAAALQRRIETQEVPKTRARDEWLWTARLAMARLPFPHRWREVFEEALHRGLPEIVEDWLKSLVPGLSRGRRSHDSVSSRRESTERLYGRHFALNEQELYQAMRESLAPSEEQIREISEALGPSEEQIRAMREALRALGPSEEQVRAIRETLRTLGPSEEQMRAIRSFQDQLGKLASGLPVRKYLEEVTGALEQHRQRLFLPYLEETRRVLESAVKPFSEIDFRYLQETYKREYPNVEAALRGINASIAEASFLGEVELDIGDLEPGREELEEPSQEEIEEQLIEIFPAEVVSELKKVEFLPLRSPDLMRNLSSFEFERFVATLRDKLGFKNVAITSRSGDQGRDILAVKQVLGIPVLFAFECKPYRPDRSVGVDLLKVLVATTSYGPTKANKGVLVTTSRFTSGARRFLLTEPSLAGKDFNSIVEWLGKVAA